MEPNNELKTFLQAIGATCEMLGLFQRELLKNGFTRAESLELCKTYLTTVVSSGTDNKKAE